MDCVVRVIKDLHYLHGFLFCMAFIRASLWILVCYLSDSLPHGWNKSGTYFGFLINLCGNWTGDLCNRDPWDRPLCDREASSNWYLFKVLTYSDELLHRWCVVYSTHRANIYIHHTQPWKSFSSFLDSPQRKAWWKLCLGQNVAHEYLARNCTEWNTKTVPPFHLLTRANKNKPILFTLLRCKIAKLTQKVHIILSSSGNIWRKLQYNYFYLIINFPWNNIFWFKTFLIV